jgi:hypothetical protein
MGARCVGFDDLWRLSIIHAVRKVRQTGKRGRFGTVLIVDTFVFAVEGENKEQEDPFFRMVLGVWEVFGSGIMDILIGEISGW